jgi:FkbM family methyltransferase
LVSATKCLIKIALGIKGRVTSVQFEVNNKNLKINVPDDQYWISIKDILLNREYEYVSEFSVKNFKGLVVDAGANSGIFSLISALFAEKVVALEPYPDNYQRLRKNIEKNFMKNIFPLNKALWYKKETLKIYEGTHSGEHSIHLHSKKFITASSTTLDELIRTFGKIDLLKIDIEGAEFSVFKNLDSEVLNRINAIVGEVHLEYGDLCSIVDKLKAEGFNVFAFNPPLCAKENSYSIRTHGLLRLRLLRRLLYTLTPFKAKTNNKLKIVFASKRALKECLT